MTVRRSSPLFFRYLRKFFLRFFVFCAMAGLYLWFPAAVDVTSPWARGHFLAPAHLFCLLLAVEMVLQVLPGHPMSLGAKKQFGRYYAPVPKGYDPAALKLALRGRTRRALVVAGVWLGVNGVFIALYFRGILGPAELMLLSALYYLGDVVCVVFFCPFQRFIMKNRCCTTCRIFAWAHWMMAAPLAVLPGVWTTPVVLLAAGILIAWETALRRRPERFWEGSNAALSCARCTDRLCCLRGPCPPGKGRA